VLRETLVAAAAGVAVDTCAAAGAAAEDAGAAGGGGDEPCAGEVSPPTGPAQGNGAARGTSSSGTRGPAGGGAGRMDCEASGVTTYDRRDTGSSTVTLPSGATAQLAPVGTPPLSPICARPWRSALIQWSASTVTSWRGAPVCPIAVTTILQVFVGTDFLGSAIGGTALARRATPRQSRPKLAPGVAPGQARRPELRAFLRPVRLHGGTVTRCVIVPPGALSRVDPRRRPQ
jgi:hypothetical protein